MAFTRLRLRLPLNKFTEQLFSISVAGRYFRLVAQEGVEVGALLLFLLLLGLDLLQQVICRAEPRPARYGRRQVHVTPFRMVRRVGGRAPRPAAELGQKRGAGPGEGSRSRSSACNHP